MPRGQLQAALYEVRDVRGDVVLPYTQVTETGITIHHTYAYRQLYVYNHTHRVVLELTSVIAARPVLRAVQL